MKKRLAAVLSCVLMMSLPFSASADALFTRDCAVQYCFAAYSAPMSQWNREMLEAGAEYDPDSDASAAQLLATYEERLASIEEYTNEVVALTAELKTRLIDYDVSLKELRLMMKRYEAIYEDCADAEQAYRLGTVKKKKLEALQAQREEAYLEIRSAVYEISIAKRDIESITGETLRDSFDFDSLYYITDAMTLDMETLNAVTGMATICAPEGYSVPASEAVDGSAELEAARSAYFELGKQLRGYVTVSKQYDETKRDFMLGLSDRYALAEAERAADDGYLAVCVAKAEYAKSLIALDQVLGGALIPANAEGDSLALAYAATIANDLRGDGIWGIYRVGDGKMLVPLILPSTVPSDAVSYQIHYNSHLIGSSPDGQACMLTDIPFDPTNGFAYVTFTDKSGTVLGTYKIDVLSPIGSFIYE